MVRRPAVVALSDVSLELDGKKVLDKVNWRVLRGENWVIIGPNGAGKTSLLSIINGYRWPSSGTVSVLGRRFGDADLRELRTEAGLVSAFLDSMIPGNEKVIDLVISGKFGSTRLWGKRTARDIAVAEATLKTAGYVEGLHKKVRELSQGERQKVAIARALMARPKMLILDEPLEGMDLPARESFLDGLERLLSKGGTSFVEVTHRTEDIPPGFTHALLLREGRVVASGRLAKTLTSENLTACLGIGVDLKRWRGRYYMAVRKGPARRPPPVR
ncbi:MAG: ATP-binding cassette domain-containing protein [Thaumarchaeota archaeon]|nr:ATP-binding cassette domain-containing protein [Nitrososphaerota archaeon]